MSFQQELQRLDTIINADGSTDEQREIATEVWERLLEEDIQAAWQRIEARTADYNALVARLAAVVDEIGSNPVSTAIDTVNEILTDVQTAAGQDG